MADNVAGSQSADYPNLNANGSGSTLQNVKDSVITNSQSAMNTIANHPVTQSVTNGPVADKARIEADKTSNEFSNVVNSRKTPDTPAATGQPLTHYHSFFYNILSWENPRITGMSFVAIIVAIFFTRYVPVLSMALKGTYIVLGIIAASELAGKLIFDKGLASQMRPRKYYTIPRENLEASLDDMEQLINFFVIEFQRIVFAENVYATVAAFASALIGYGLIKFVPKWGIALIATSVIYLVPFVYIYNRELIDGHLNNAGNIINEQATQVRSLAAEHTGRATEVAKSSFNQYSAKAQEMMGQAQNKAASSDAPNPANLNPVKDEPARNISKSDFPAAPSSEPVHTETAIPQTEPRVPQNAY